MRKFIATIAVLALSASVLAGCGKKLIMGKAPRPALRTARKPEPRRKMVRKPWNMAMMLMLTESMWQIM